MYVDSHCHLEGARFAQDREQVLVRARQASVEAVVAIGNGNGPDDVACGIELAARFDPQPATDSALAVDRRPRTVDSPKIFATIGIHPHEARLAEERHYANMESLARDPRVIAWGEIGLDYHYDHSPRDVQRQVFVRQLELASAARLPVIIHCRASENSTNAWDDCLEILRDAWAASGMGGILHCFTGEMRHAQAALDLGFMISFAGNVTYPKATNIRQAASELPLDRILIETDSPYLAPIPYRGKRNEPAYVVETARHIGELRGVSGEDIGRATTENFFRFFQLR